MGTLERVLHGALDHAELAALGLQPQQVLDYSCNLNPFGPPPEVRAALAALDPAPYPDRSCHTLRLALAGRHSGSLEQILAGNGANELIHLIARALLKAGDRVLVVAPTFGEYAHASLLAGAQVATWSAQAQHGFAIDTAALQESVRSIRPRLVWLCAPNNPTGATLATGAILALSEVCAAHQGLLVLDRAYEAMVREQNNQLPAALPTNIISLHSLTKSYALAGLRLGYLLAQPALVAQIARFQPAWSVSSAAQVAGLAALEADMFLPTTIPLLWQASDQLYDGLCRLGSTIWRGALPFLLVRTGNGANTRALLLQQGIAVRDCASFGLPEWVRVAPRTPAENTRLLEVWKECL